MSCRFSDPTFVLPAASGNSSALIRVCICATRINGDIPRIPTRSEISHICSLVKCFETSCITGGVKNNLICAVLYSVKAVSVCYLFLKSVAI